MPVNRIVRLGLVWLALLGAAGVRAQMPAAGGADELEVGRRIYEQGLLPAGARLTGVRGTGVAAEGAGIACVSCHRRSGMGSVEGDIQVSPISGDALFGTGNKVVINMDTRSRKRFNLSHEPYDDVTLADAIRHGVNNAGQPINPMMPRYALGDAEMKALVAYLRQLSSGWSPGVSQEQIRFATIITPGVDAARRTVFLDMMKAAFFQKNAATALASASGRRHMAGAAEFVLGTERRWALDVWELEGPPDTWRAQLEEHYRRQPVFAIASGLASGTWAPVQAFCEEQHLPSWFPSVDAPPDSKDPVYTLYFSRGAALEADVLAHKLRQLEGRKPSRIVQIHRDEQVANSAAQALAHALAGTDLRVVDRIVGDADPATLGRAMSELGAQDVVVGWLRPDDIAALEGIAPPPASALYFSGALSRGEQAPFPASWKEAGIHLAYGYELPEKRMANLAYFKAWLNRIGVPLVDEPWQSEVYFSLSFLRDTTTEMLDNLYRDYLLERAETMISRREIAHAEEETRTSTLGIKSRLAAPGEARELSTLQMAGTSMDKREGTTAYPHLALGPGQRFASKGAYIVRFASAQSSQLVAESDWIVP